MNPAREIIEYLIANTAFVVGTDLFQGSIPDTNLNGVVVTHQVVGENDTAMQQIQLNFASHYDDYDTANDKLVVIYDLLAYAKGLTITSGYIFSITVIKSVGFVTITDEHKYIFSCSLLCYITRP